MASGGTGNNSDYIKPVRQNDPLFYAEGEDVQEVLDFLKMTGEDLVLQYRESPSDTYSTDKTPGNELNELLASNIEADQGYNLAISSNGYNGNTLVSGTISNELPSTSAERAGGLPSVEEGTAFDGFTDRSAEEIYHETRNVGLKEARPTKKAERLWNTLFMVL